MHPRNDVAWPVFWAKHNEQFQKLKKHIRSGYCRKTRKEKKALLRELRKRDAPFLAANNLQARVNFAKIWLREGFKYGHRRQCYLVTLTPSDFAMSFDHAMEFDVRHIHRWAKRVLTGFDYIANVEIAPYTNWQYLLLRGHAYHYHVHAIVFSPDIVALEQRFAEANRAYSSLLPSRPAFHKELIAASDLKWVLLYPLKGIVKNYRAYPVMRERVDEDGMVQKEPTGAFRQRDKPANPGLAIKVRALMQNAHLDKWVFAGGAGKPILKAIKEEALRRLPHRLRSKRQSAFRDHFTPEEDS
ncbi:hypothetical protein RPMA_19135 [Tardiphaga alba]|uniref:Replication initiation protein n=1 Tax=Tardiphaga alba TaxID=340268 RepID=A0ABX8AEG9_9BRAD|nr:hypothetical protein [Tardiphaga alba]QUS40710.1 hypothetical protein RPMA_19135 [Tardiphaga alba]